ncbi:MAG: DUF732 domain-containing protein [Mycobacterium sp.]
MSITAMLPRLAAILAAFALFATTVPLVAVAAPAHADPGNDVFYIDLLRGLDVYNHYGDQAWLQEGHKVCSAFHRGATEDSATDMVQSDLGTSTYQAYRVVTAAELGLGCFTMKYHDM